MSDKIMWPIETIKESPLNKESRSIEPEKKAKLKESLQKYGQLIPLLIDIRPDHYGEALGGRHTFECLQELGVTMVWVEPRQPNSDAEAFELSVLHNQQYAQYLQHEIVRQANQYKNEINLSGLSVAMDTGVDLKLLAEELEGSLPDTELPDPEEAAKQIVEEPAKQEKSEEKKEEAPKKEEEKTSTNDVPQNSVPSKEEEKDMDTIKVLKKKCPHCGTDVYFEIDEAPAPVSQPAGVETEDDIPDENPLPNEPIPAPKYTWEDGSVHDIPESLGRGLK